MRASQAALLSVVLAPGVARCGGSDGSEGAPATGAFVGEVSEGDAFVAVEAGKENVVAYVCNGGRGIAEFFAGRRRDGRVKLVSARRATLPASIGADGTTGTIELAGRGRVEFSAEPAEGEAGLYRVPRARPVRAAWVVLDDGRQRGTFARSTVDPGATTASIRDREIVSVARVTPRQVSAAGFMGCIPPPCPPERSASFGGGRSGS